MHEPLPTWHAGETLIQERLGVRERLEALGPRVIRPFMPDQHRQFFAQLPFVVLGSVDAAGDAWATILEGQPGFLASPTPTTLDLAARPASEDPAAPGLGAGAAVGLLGIEWHTRRRNRMNGILSPTAQGLRVTVDQSFGNCPRYIQLRDLSFAHEPGAALAVPSEHPTSLDAAARALIAGADAFFVASYADPQGQRRVDVSHRGGKPGFVRVDAEGLLTIPDFNGNLFFNTLGNVIANGRAGLLFVDLEHGDLLQLSGTAEVLFDSPEIAAFEGAERLWTFRPQRIVRRRSALALRWQAQPGGESDSSRLTGSWADAERRLQASPQVRRWRPLRIARIVQESATIRSFHLEPLDGAALPPYQAGQFLPLRVTPEAGQPSLVRTYTLTSLPADGHYRISVKRDGLVSRLLHDRLREGDLIEARAPAGDFTLAVSAARPLVFLAAGIGITPLLAMLRQAVHQGRRPVTLFYGARTQAERAFDRELSELMARAPETLRVIRVLSDPAAALPGVDYDVAGRIDMALLGRHLPFGDYDFYLCGPTAFTQGLYDGLRGFGIEDGRIHAEAFGPAGRVRSGAATAATVRPAAATKAVRVRFAASGQEAQWTPASGSLLELAEAQGLEPAFSCREGHCGSCRTGLLQGAVTYAKEPAAAVAVDQALLCCARPAAGSVPLELDL
ncbi:pyridoxamine 5'-phosphate oxidase family protein [Pseudomonas sp. 102515]|uniref:2Fe-2S iron-sulfur cluster-binding protein n=1 Tax=Pseudomonas sp. 102515 TaxID=3071568 RepID=UPI002802694A|nr:pyridoxamine 5'-phosphate oxidase family protein [Pseudomonas sp. 102515]MDQ7911602.1 pyridoxamine 5'-phosphate oxidase family protein [Pseudomonas sp. 102515]